MDPGSLLLIVVVFVVVFWFMSRGQKKQQKQVQDQMAALEPGTWVMTTTGFYGRLVDIDGDVAVLETTDGTETYWLRQALRGPQEPPFAAEISDEAAADAAEPSDVVAEDEVEATSSTDHQAAQQASTTTQGHSEDLGVDEGDPHSEGVVIDDSVALGKKNADIPVSADEEAQNQASDTDDLDERSKTDSAKKPVNGDDL